MKKLILISGLCSLMAVSVYASGGLFNIPPEDTGPVPEVPTECTDRPNAEKSWACCRAWCRVDHDKQSDIEACYDSCDAPASNS